MKQIVIYDLGLTKKVLRSTISEREAEKQVCKNLYDVFPSPL